MLYDENILMIKMKYMRFCNSAKSPDCNKYMLHVSPSFNCSSGEQKKKLINWCTFETCPRSAIDKNDDFFEIRSAFASNPNVLLPINLLTCWRLLFGFSGTHRGSRRPIDDVAKPQRSPPIRIDRAGHIKSGVANRTGSVEIFD